jgi:pimeloyl-ACP methyl ester carboxylesterase
MSSPIPLRRRCGRRCATAGLLLPSALVVATAAAVLAPALATAQVGWDNRYQQELILIHSIGSSASVWDEMVPFVSSGMTVWTYELPGHGTTPPISSPTIEKIADGLADFIREHGIDYPALVGHGMGGMIAMQYTFDHPQDVYRLIVIDAGPKQLVTEEMKVQIAEALATDYDRFVASRYLDVSPREEIAERVMDQALKTDATTFASLIMSSFDYDLTPKLPLQSVPILVVGSGTFFPDASLAPALLDQIGYAEARSISFKHMEHTGHFVMLERPVYLASVILAFTATQHDR